jgi:NAD(P)-dependent dehydrogenase (short-subunit alcohol dehydrogenase family)
MLEQRPGFILPGRSSNAGISVIGKFRTNENTSIGLNMCGSILEREAVANETPPSCILVAGASGGIGRAFCRQLEKSFPSATVVRLARDLSKLQPLATSTVDVAFDIGEEDRIREAIARIPGELPIDWVFVATGWLHDAGVSPEKTFRNLDADNLMHAYRVNAIGPALLLKHLIPKLNPANNCRLGIVSARVGSISDNRLGGWHSYRASKAALNMLIKNFAIELTRNKRHHIVVGLQPGTTDTALSAPFQRNVAEGQLQTPDYTAAQLFKVMQKLRPDDSGGLFDFLGIPFTP